VFAELHWTPGVMIQVPEREFFIDNLLVRIRFIIVMIWWTGLAPWEFMIQVSGQAGRESESERAREREREATGYEPFDLDGWA